MNALMLQNIGQILVAYPLGQDDSRLYNTVYHRGMDFMRKVLVLAQGYDTPYLPFCPPIEKDEGHEGSKSHDKPYYRNQFKHAFKLFCLILNRKVILCSHDKIGIGEFRQGLFPIKANRSGGKPGNYVHQTILAGPSKRNPKANGRNKPEQICGKSRQSAYLSHK